MEKWNTILRRERKLRSLSQSELAEMLGCDTKTVGRWERGEAFPSPYFIRQLTELFNKDSAALGLVETGREPAGRADWSEAPDVLHFLGRENELARIDHWIKDEQCRVIAILGLGGCGKTTFARVAAERAADSFDCVLWYSLRNAPPVERFLERCFQFFLAGTQDWKHEDMNEGLSLLVNVLSRERCLLIIDNVESILQGGQQAGRYLVGYEGYEALFQRLASSRHRSCLLLTSREKPGEVALLEGPASPVRSLTLPGLEPDSGQLLLQVQGLDCKAEDCAALIRLYLGNPLALKLASGFIRDLFDGNIAAFLAEGVSVFAGIHDLLAQQFQRLSDLEQDIMFWLAIEREPVSLNTLHEDMAVAISRTAVFEAAESLRRRSMIEMHTGRLFTLQPVIMEYITGLLTTRMHAHLVAKQLSSFGKYALLKAQASDYIRESQARLLLTPIATMLLATPGEQEAGQRLLDLLVSLQSAPRSDSYYAAGNLFNLLITLRVNLRGLDCTHLSIHQADFRGVDLPMVNFSHADLSACAFTDAFTCVLCLATTRDGQLLAAGMTTGEVRIWQAGDMTPLFTCIAHTEEVRSVAFSPHGDLLASASEDHTIRLWDMRSGRCRLVLHEHTDMVRSVAFSADGRLLASAGEDQTVRVWEAATGRLLHILSKHEARVRVVAFHPERSQLASGGDDGIIRLWDGEAGHLHTTFAGQCGFIFTLAFHPVGEILASGSEDHTVRLWDVQSGALLAVLEGHRERVRTLAYSADGRYLASGSDDGTIYLWDTATNRPLRMFQGHTNRVWSLVFDASDGLISASEDDTLRWWEARTGHCLRLLRGYTDLIKAVSFSPDGRLVASGSEDCTIRLWNVQTGHWHKVLYGHSNRVRTVAISPDGRLLASGSEDETIRLWDIATGHCLHTLRGHTHLVRSLAFDARGVRLVSAGHDMRIHLWDVHSGRLLRSWEATRQGRLWAVAFHPEGQMIASGGDDPAMQIWSLEADEPLHSLRGHTHRVWSVAFNSSGSLLATCSDDLSIRLWDTTTWNCLRIIEGHEHWVRMVCFNPKGDLLASGSHDMMVRLWDVATGRCLHTLAGHRGFIWSVAFSPDGQFLASGSDDGTVRIWEAASGACLRILRRERPYEGMDITGVRGLSEAQKEALRLLGAIEN
jgi:WD40 repeat protein/transcriptional regulator with XRE-family HTH domain